MKKRGSLIEYNKARLADLMRAYKEYIANIGRIVMSEAYKHIADMPAKRFWVSEVRASVIVSKLMRGENILKKMRPSKREMFREIYRRVIAMQQEHPEMPISVICAKVVAQPAPKFYLSPGSVKIMICKAKDAKKKSGTPYL